MLLGMFYKKKIRENHIYLNDTYEINYQYVKQWSLVKEH